MSQDTLLHRLVRPLVRPLARTPVRPDHLTMLRAATGLAAAGLFLRGGPGAIDAGAALLVASCLLDRGDGELARLTGHFSGHGRRWDLMADCGVDALVFAGLGGGAWARLGGWGPLLGLSAALAVVMLFRQLHGAEPAAVPGPTLPATPGRDPRATQGSRAVSSRRTAAGGRTARGRRVAVDPDDAMLGVPLLLWAVGPVPVLLLAGILTPLAVVGVWVASRR